MTEGTDSDQTHTHRVVLQQLFQDIHRDIATANARRGLTTLYVRARSLLLLTHARSWEGTFGADVSAIRMVAEEEWATTAGAINRHAEALDIPADYAEEWTQAP